MGTTNVPIHSFLLQGDNTCFTGFNFVTTGTYAASDITNFKLYYTTTNTFATTNLLSTISSPSVAGIQTVPTFSLNLTGGTNYYLWITADVAASVTNGHTLGVNSTSASNITPNISSTPIGTATASGTQTFYNNAGIGLTSAAGTDNQTKCVNTALTAITYTTTGGATGANVTGLPAGVISAYNSGTVTISGMPTTAGTYNYTIATTGNCTQTNATGTITVNSYPTIINASQTICSGQTATLTATGAISYTWTPGGATTASISVTPSVTTTYTVAGNNNACASTATVTVNPLPTITLSPSTLCIGATTTLTASGTNVTNYLWSTGATTSAITVNPPSVQTYTVTATNSCGNASLTVSSIVCCNGPTVTATNAATICNGSPVTLTASGADFYSWAPSTGLNVTTGASVSAFPINPTTYTVTGYMASDLASGSELVVNGAFENEIVPSTDKLFPATSSATNGYYFDPFPNCGCVFIESKPYQLPNTEPVPVPGPDANNVYLIGIVDIGKIVWENDLPITIVPNASYLFSFWVNQNEAHHPLYWDITINGQQVGRLNSEGRSQEWRQYSVVWNSDIATTADIKIISGGVRTQYVYFDDISFRKISGCSTAAYALSTVNVNPQVSFTSAPIGTDSMQLTATNNANYIYSWSTGQTGNTIIIPTPNNTTTAYTLNVAASGGCARTYTITPDFYGDIIARNDKSEPTYKPYPFGKPKSSLNPPDNSSSPIGLYPNPNNGNMTLNYDLKQGEFGNMYIYDLLGQIVGEYQLDESKTQLHISNNSLTGGAYVYRVVINGTEVKTGKIIVVR